MMTFQIFDDDLFYPQKIYLYYRMKQEYNELFELIDTNKELLPTGDYIKICNIFKEIYKNNNTNDDISYMYNIEHKIMRDFCLKYKNYCFNGIDCIDNNYYMWSSIDNYKNCKDFKLVEISYLSFNVNTFNSLKPSVINKVCLIYKNNYLNFKTEKSTDKRKFFSCNFIEHTLIKKLVFLRLTFRNDHKFQLYDRNKNKYISPGFSVQIPNNILIDIKIMKTNTKKYDKFFEEK